jgi:hypothetical protein
MARYENKLLLGMANGQPCMLQIPGICQDRRDTVVAAHENSLSAGKGMGIKADDCFAVPACFECHDEYDGRSSAAKLSREDREWYFAKALRRWWKYMWENEVIQVRK